jgi:hypothetical protein
MSHGERLRYPLSSGTHFGAAFRRASRSDFQKSWAETSLESLHARHADTLTKASDACQIFAARGRIVSGTQIRLNREKSARHFKAIFWIVISEFESSQPSQPLGSLCAMSGLQKYARHSRELARRYEVSEAQFSEFLAAMGQFREPVSSRQFSISVLRWRRLGSKSNETGLAVREIACERFVPMRAD